MTTPTPVRDTEPTPESPISLGLAAVRNYLSACAPGEAIPYEDLRALGDIQDAADYARRLLLAQACARGIVALYERNSALEQCTLSAEVWDDDPRDGVAYELILSDVRVSDRMLEEGVDVDDYTDILGALLKRDDACDWNGRPEFDLFSEEINTFGTLLSWEKEHGGLSYLGTSRETVVQALDKDGLRGVTQALFPKLVAKSEKYGLVLPGPGQQNSTRVRRDRPGV